MRSRKSPQEKKRVSLKKDRRNAYRENDKASRKSIPRAKAKVNRVNRRSNSVALSDAIGVPDEDLESAIEDRVLGRRRKVWRKWPDESLGRKLARRDGGDDALPFAHATKLALSCARPGQLRQISASACYLRCRRTARYSHAVELTAQPAACRSASC